MEFHFRDYTLKKKQQNPSVQYIYLPQDLVFPFSCNLSCPGGCWLPHMGCWWTVRLRRRNALFSDKLFLLPTLKMQQIYFGFFFPQNFQAEQARWRMEKRREQQSSVTFSRTCSRSDWEPRWESRSPESPSTIPLLSQEGDQSHCTSDPAQLPLPLKIIRKRSVNSCSKMMAELIMFYSCCLPLHR